MKDAIDVRKSFGAYEGTDRIYFTGVRSEKADGNVLCSIAGGCWICKEYRNCCPELENLANGAKDHGE